jgi:hypothetical protein
MKTLLLLTLSSILPSMALEELPYDIKRLIEQRDTAVQKIDKIFVKELKKKLADFMKNGDLETANRITKIIGTIEIPVTARNEEQKKWSEEEFGGSTWRNEKGDIFNFRKGNSFHISMSNGHSTGGHKWKILKNGNISVTWAKGETTGPFEFGEERESAKWVDGSTFILQK